MIHEKATSYTDKRLSKAFVWFHAASANGGAMAIAGTISAYFTIYAQETLGITAAHLSVIMLICSIWDAVSTPLMGVICDSCTPRWGRYRTWFLFTPIFLLIDMFLLFSNPGFIQGSAVTKSIYLCLTYLMYGTCVTAYTMPHMAILPALTLDEKERNDVLSKGAGVCALMYTIASTFTPQLVSLVGSYRSLMIIYAVFSAVCFWGLYKTSEERYVTTDAERGQGGLKQLLLVFRHRELWPLMLCWCLASISYGFMFTSSVYYAQYTLAGNRVDFSAMGEDVIGSTVGSTISTYMGFVSVGALLSMAFLMPLFLRIFRKGWKAMLVSQALTAVLYMVLYFTGRINFWYCCLLSFIAAAVGSMVNALVNILVNDAIDFILLKEGQQLNGVVSSAKTFAQKCGATATNSGVLAILAVCGFRAELGPFGQSELVAAGINAVRFLIPAIISALIVLLMFFYPIKKHFVEIEKMKEDLTEFEKGCGQK